MHVYINNSTYLCKQPTCGTLNFSKMMTKNTSQLKNSLQCDLPTHFPFKTWNLFLHLLESGWGWVPVTALINSGHST